MATILNKIRLIRKESVESKKIWKLFLQNIKVKSHPPVSQFSIVFLRNVMISICVILAVLNIHYLIFLDMNSFHKTINKLINLKLDKNKSLFIIKLIKADVNLSNNSINIIVKKLNSFVANSSEDSIKNYKNDEESFNYITFLKVWSWITMSLFTISTFTINSISILCIYFKNKNLIRLRRIKVNGYMIKVFMFQNIIFLASSLPNEFLLINHRINYFYDEIRRIRMICDFFSYSKNLLSVFVYVFFFKNYRCLFLNVSNKNDQKTKIEEKTREINQIELKTFEKEMVYKTFEGLNEITRVSS